MRPLPRPAFIAALERRIGALPARAALVVLLLPVLALLPLKLGALWLVACGRAVAGAAVYLVAKVLGAAVFARLFFLVRPRLMTLPWFARWDARWRAWRARRRR